MIQVSNGRRSRSPLSPLSLRMMSRADLSNAPRDRAVVGGVVALDIKMNLGLNPDFGLNHDLNFILDERVDWHFALHDFKRH